MPLQNRDPLTRGGGELSSSTAGLQSCECPSGSLALAACCLYSHTRTACWKRPKHIYIRTPGASCISVPTNVSVSEDKIMLVLGHCQCSKQIRSSLVSLHMSFTPVRYAELPCCIILTFSQRGYVFTIIYLKLYLAEIFICMHVPTCSCQCY